MSSLSEKIYNIFDFKYDKNVFKKVYVLKDEYESLFPLDENEKDGLNSYLNAFNVRFVYNSNAIEGSTLSLSDTAVVLEGEFTPHDPSSNLKDIFAAKGCFEGAEYALSEFSKQSDLTEEFIKDIHEKTALDCQPRTRGSYRLSPVYIRGSMTVPVSPDKIRECMADLIYQYNYGKFDELLKIAAFHAAFEMIHPFIDGNGRTGRIIMNAMLEKAGFPLIAIKFTSRGVYNHALENWQVHDDGTEFLELFAKAIVEEYQEKINIINVTRQMLSEMETEDIEENDIEL